jgi:hypothetical protein
MPRVSHAVRRRGSLSHVLDMMAVRLATAAPTPGRLPHGSTIQEAPMPGHHRGVDHANRLRSLTEILEAAHHRSPDQRASLVRVRDLHSDSFELALRAVDDGDVFGRLLGEVVPDDWDAAGLVVHGTARSLGDPDRDLRPGDRLGRVCTAVVCDRLGTVASTLRIGDGEPRSMVHGPDDPAGGVGRMLDALRRSVGVATPPPVADSAGLALALWLHRVLEAASAGRPTDPGHIDRLRPRLPADWAQLRSECAAGGWVELDIAPDLAAWMDDGMFSRSCFAAFPDPLEVLVELSELLAPESWRHLAGPFLTGAADIVSS